MFGAPGRDREGEIGSRFVECLLILAYPALLILLIHNVKTFLGAVNPTTPMVNLWSLTAKRTRITFAVSYFVLAVDGTK